MSEEWGDLLDLSLRRLAQTVDRRKLPGTRAQRGWTSVSLMAVGLLFLAASTAFAAPEDPAPGDALEAQSYLNQRKWPEAAILLRKVLRQNPDSARTAEELTRALLYSGRREEALSVFGQVMLKTRSRDRAALERRARVMSRIFLTQDSAQLFQEGMMQLLEKKYRLALEKFNKAVESEPDNVEVLLRLGQCLLLEGDPDSAAERLKLARKLNPYEPEIHLWLGRALKLQGDFKEAITELKFASEKLPGSSLAPVWYADALAASGASSSAIPLLEKDARNYPDHVRSIVAATRMRISATSPRDITGLWNIRRELQAAFSRLGDYMSHPALPEQEGELNVDLRDEAEMKTEIVAQLGQLEQLLGPSNGTTGAGVAPETATAIKKSSEN